MFSPPFTSFEAAVQRQSRSLTTPRNAFTTECASGPLVLNLCCNFQQAILRKLWIWSQFQFPSFEIVYIACFFVQSFWNSSYFSQRHHDATSASRCWWTNNQNDEHFFKVVKCYTFWMLPTPFIAGTALISLSPSICIGNNGIRKNSCELSK